MSKKPKASNSFAEKEIAKASEQFDQFEKSVQDLTLDRMNEAPKREFEAPQVSQKEIDKSKDIYLKPKRTIYPSADPKTGKTEKFNENFRSQYEFEKEYVQFIAENKEVIGENIELWTKRFPGTPAEEWSVPTNKPVWGPRYLAEQIKRKCYHRLQMQPEVTAANGDTSFYGKMIADTTIQRLDAHPVGQRKSVFMGS